MYNDLTITVFFSYVYAEMQHVYDGGTSILLESMQGGTWQLKTGISIHFFTSHTPCEFNSSFLLAESTGYFSP